MKNIKFPDKQLQNNAYAFGPVSRIITEASSRKLMQNVKTWFLICLKSF